MNLNGHLVVEGLVSVLEAVEVEATMEVKACLAERSVMVRVYPHEPVISRAKAVTG